jgi:hypothetical protein
MTAPYATCSCGAEFDAAQVSRLQACPVCGENFSDSSGGAPVDVAAIRREAGLAVAAEDGEIALELLRRHAPEIVALVDEMSTAISGLMTPCRCASLRRIGAKPAPKEACPHVRGARALARAGRPFTKRSAP